MRLFDTHSHINADDFDADRAAVIVRMREAGLVGAMVVACDWGEEKKLFEVLDLAPGFLYGAWALHPEYKNKREPGIEEILAVCEDPRIKAVGETGLDYHWCKGELTWQKERFAKHIAAAKMLGKPVIVHAREAEFDALDILLAEGAADVGFVLHCFGNTLEVAKRALDLGGLISVTGVVTFKNAQGLRDVASALPLEGMMVETDCPYMAPVPYRGKRCEPAHVAQVVRMIAELKGLDLEYVGEVTTETALKFFRIGN